MAQTVKNLPAKWETQVSSLGWKIHWRRKWQPSQVFLPRECYSQSGPKDSDTTYPNPFTVTFVFTEHVFWASGHLTLYLDYVLQASQPACEPNVILPLDVRWQQRFRVTGRDGEGGTPKSVSLQGLGS